jgi:peptidoglycan/LPS O-acetylase OafA/YrhL
LPSLEALGKKSACDAHSDSPRRLPELDGLRGIAIGMVLLFHCFQQIWVTRPGSFPAYLQASARLTWSGVDLFFVLSGFLIGGILLDARNSRNYFQVFYARRFFRIVPIYAVILLSFPTLIAAARNFSHYDFPWLTANSLPWYGFWSFTQNFWMALRGSFGTNSLAVTWSLAVEEQFYLTLPFLVRIMSGRALTLGVSAGVCLAPLLRFACRVAWPHNLLVRSVLMPCRADALLLGVLAAIMIRDATCRDRIVRNPRVLLCALSILLCGIAALTWRTRNGNDPLLTDVGFTWIALFYSGLLLLALTQPDSAVGRALRLPLLTWLGSIAYGAYLLHQTFSGLLFGIFWRHQPAITGFYTLGTAILALTLTLSVAQLSWRFFESPLVKIGHRQRYSLSPSENQPSAVQAYS